MDASDKVIAVARNGKGEKVFEGTAAQVREYVSSLHIETSRALWLFFFTEGSSVTVSHRIDRDGRDSWVAVACSHSSADGIASSVTTCEDKFDHVAKATRFAHGWCLAG